MLGNNNNMGLNFNNQQRQSLTPANNTPNNAVSGGINWPNGGNTLNRSATNDQNANKVGWLNTGIGNSLVTQNQSFGNGLNKSIGDRLNVSPSK
jgi:hypothetical protein